MKAHVLKACAAAIVAALFGLSLRGDGRAFYGDPRFYAEQAPTHLIHNYYPGSYPSDEFIVTIHTGSDLQLIVRTERAVAAWNDALRATPNSITKYPLHMDYNNPYDDPHANIIVNYVSASEIDQQCGTQADACNDGQQPITHIWLDIDRSTIALVTHELGHSLEYTDQYNSNFTCSPADTIMNSNATDCHTSITATDKNDFMYHYEPTYQSANPSYPDTWGSTWNAYYQTGSVREWFAPSFVDWSYFWEKDSDTGGGLLASGYTQLPNDYFADFSFTASSRFCIFNKIYNEVGYPGTRPWSPRSQYSCVGSALSQSAGYFLATSDRADTSNNLYLRVKNFSGFTRDIAIVGPAFENIGCGYVSTAWQATRQCAISLSRGAYPYLQWYAKDPNNGSIYSYGLLDFE